MQWFYDGQIRRYITQMIRLMSNFSYKDGNGTVRQVPVLYGDMTRQVANIIKENSENKLPSVPRMAVYMTSLAMDRERTADSTHVSKLHIRERTYDENNNEYLSSQGKNYTVERLMPTPYTLGLNVDIWTSNTDQKLQIMEQLMMLFNPSLEIQTTDNYVDWTSLTVVNLEDINVTNRTIPVGTESEIDIATMSFTTPIWISPPAKVKRLGVITNVVMSIFDESKGTIDLGLSYPDVNRWDDDEITGTTETNAGRTVETQSSDNVVSVTYQNYGAFVDGSTITLIKNGSVGQTSWIPLLETIPGEYQPDVSRIFLSKLDTDTIITGTFSVNELDPNEIEVVWDTDSFPSDTIISGSTGINYIIDPSRSSPADIKTPGVRILLLGSVGDASNLDGADAWKNLNGSDFVASENDIVEWDGNNWNIVFDASETTTITYVTNLNTLKQYRWDGENWLLSIDGEYPGGTWRLDLEG